MININEILKWFKDSEEVNRALQKNVREFLGDSFINKDIENSYMSAPDWFWYKHSGIIIFADNITIENSENPHLVLRNPQIVNGGQTIRTLFSAFSKNNRNDNNAKVLLRAYRLPYENFETYKRSIDIISVLNTQAKILSSDLRSTDPRQVRLEKLFHKLEYKYWKKRSKEAKSAKLTIIMRNLALRYYICKNKAPHIGVMGKVEELLITDFHNRFNRHKVTLIMESIQFPQICYSARAHESVHLIFPHP